MTNTHTHTPDFRIDWSNRDAVVALANRLGPGHSVVKATNRKHFNVILTTSEDKPRIGPIAVVHRT